MTARPWALPASLAVACLIATTALLAFGRADARIRDSSRPEPALGTPILSPRRAPEVLAATVGEVRLTVALDQALDDERFRGTNACLTVEQGERLVYGRNADASLVPASTMKVVTGMAALRRLGEDFTYVTGLRAAAPPADGVIDGPLWLVGSGDPLLATEGYAASFRNQPQVYTSLESLADALVANGVREVRGGVVGDESRYDRSRYVPSWKPVYLTDNDVGPASALSVNDGFTQYRPRPRKHAAQPATHAAATFAFLLGARGVKVGGPPSEGVAPADSVALTSISSPPLPEIVGELLRESDNMTAELLVKELGKRFGADGTWGDGLAVIRDIVGEAGLPVEAYRAVDGSGLDVSDRLSCTLLMDALDLAGPGGAVAAGFPIAGQTGTLVDRFKGSPAEGKLRAKTGSLNNVAGLAGFVESSGAGTLEFALLANDLPDQTVSGRALQERVGAALSVYPAVAPIDELEPLAPASR